MGLLTVIGGLVVAGLIVLGAYTAANRITNSSPKRRKGN